MSSYFKIQDEVYGRITAGYLEPMFAGISSEILLSIQLIKIMLLDIEINHCKGQRI